MDGHASASLPNSTFFTMLNVSLSISRHLARLGELVEDLHAAVLAEVLDDRLRRAPAHRGERVEVPGRIAAERLAEQLLGRFGQVGEIELLAGPLQLDEVVRELDAVGRVHLDREAQEDRRVARVAAVDDADVARARCDQLGVLRHRHRRDVREHLAMRAIERQAALLVVVQAAVRVDVDGHGGIRGRATGPECSRARGEGVARRAALTGSTARLAPRWSGARRTARPCTIGCHWPWITRGCEQRLPAACPEAREPWRRAGIVGQREREAAIRLACRILGRPGLPAGTPGARCGSGARNPSGALQVAHRGASTSSRHWSPGRSKTCMWPDGRRVSVTR